MDLSDKPRLYKIVCARDNRYDGRFYCGVKTTGIYCRPICPARPKLENITFFRSSAEAENAGYRPCMRCRPDFAPNSVQWIGTAAVVGRALSLISRGDMDEASLEQIAEKVGVSARHLRRLFDEHIGASPMDVAASKRLHLAKHLLTHSALPITEVAFASGYQSIRRFNDAFKEKFKTAPSVIRKDQVSEGESNFIRVILPLIDPFDWGQIFGFLKAHRTEGVEDFTDGRYRRNFAVRNTVGALEVAFELKQPQLSIAISISNTAHLRSVIERVRDLFDTRLNPHAHLNDLNTKDLIADCYKNQLGIRIPGAWEPFETAVCIILSQLVSVEQARLKVKRLVERFGIKLSRPVFAGCTHLFPIAKALTRANLRCLGVTKIRENALRELSRQVFTKRIDLSRSSDIEKTKAQLLAIKGIGPWTTEMIAMRCLGDTNAFPKTDLIIKRALEHHQIRKGDWSPWNSYITLALWKKHALSLSKKSRGVMSGR